jgi:hypothetical protein
MAGPERKQCRFFFKKFKWFELIQLKDGVPKFKKNQIRCGCGGN